MTMTNEQVHKGRCLCGAVRYEVQGEPQIVAHCHCVDCQRLTGAGHSTGAMFAADRFRMTGEVAQYRLQSDNGVTVSLGTIEDSSAFEPAVVVFARNRKPWDAMDASVATFDAQPQWNPNDAQ